MSSKLLCHLIHGSSTLALCLIVAQKSTTTLSTELVHGGTTTLNISLEQIWYLAHDVMTSLLTFMEYFGTKGLAEIVGENVFAISTQLLIVAAHFTKVDELPIKAHLN